MNRRNERLNVPVNRTRPNLAGNRRPQLGGCHQNGEYNPYTVYQLRKQQLHASNCSNLINGKAEVRRNSNGESSDSSSTSIIGLLSKIDHNQEFEPQILQTPVMQSQQVQTHQLHYMPSLRMQQQQQQQQQMQSPMMQQADMQTQTASPVISTVASNTSDEIFFRKVAEFHKENENFLKRRRAEDLAVGQTASLTSRFEMPPKIPPRLNRASILRMQHLEQRQEYCGRSTNLLKFGTDPFKPKQMPVREEAAQTALEVYTPQLVSRIVFKPNDGTVGASVQCETLEMGLTPNVAGIAAGTQTLNIPPRARGRPRMSERERAKQMLRHSVSPQLRRAAVERNRKARLQRPGKKPMKTESMFTLTSTSNIAVNILPKFPRKPQPRKPKKRPLGKELAKRKKTVKRLQRDRPKQLIPKDDEIPKGSPKCKPRTRMKKPPKKLPYKNIGAARKKANDAKSQRQKTVAMPNPNIETNVENVQGQRGNGRTRAGGGMDEHTARFLQREREKFLEKHLGRRYLETHHCLENSANRNQRRPLHMSKNLKGLDATTMLRWGMRRAPLQTKPGATFTKTPRKKRLLKKVIVKPKPNTRQHFTMPKMKDPRTGSWVPAFKNMDEYLQTIYAPSQYILLEKRRNHVKCPVCMKLHKPGSSLRYALAISKKPTFLL